MDVWTYIRIRGKVITCICTCDECTWHMNKVPYDASRQGHYNGQLRGKCFHFMTSSWYDFSRHAKSTCLLMIRLLVSPSHHLVVLIVFSIIKVLSEEIMAKINDTMRWHRGAVSLNFKNRHVHVLQARFILMQLFYAIFHREMLVSTCYTRGALSDNGGSVC